jgi:hypothetical protein
VIYRNPAPDNDDLLNYRLWLVARAADGRPVLLSVTPVDGEVALLRYFRTLGTGQEQSHARYLMTEVLVERLVRLGARYLVDGSNLFLLPNGLRHFQQMVGFRIVRLRIARSGGNIGDTVMPGLEVMTPKPSTTASTRSKPPPHMRDFHEAERAVVPAPARPGG